MLGKESLHFSLSLSFSLFTHPNVSSLIYFCLFGMYLGRAKG